MYLGGSRDTYKPSDLLLYISCRIGDNSFINFCLHVPAVSSISHPTVTREWLFLHQPENPIFRIATTSKAIVSIICISSYVLIIITPSAELGSGENTFSGCPGCGLLPCSSYRVTPKALAILSKVSTWLFP